MDRYGAILVSGAALLASFAGLFNEFTQDDLRLIQDNVRVHGLGHWREIFTSPYWPPPWHQELYRPLTTLFHAVQFSVAGGNPLLFRLVSYLLYALVSVGVLRLGGRILPGRIALAVALLFAVHPVHVEAVALAVGQSELLVGLVSVAMTVRYLDARRRGSPTATDWGVLAGLYLIACMAKEQGLLLPALLVAAEACLLGGAFASRVRNLWAGYGLLTAIAVAVVLVRRAVLGGEFAGVFTAEALQGLSLGGRALTMLRVAPEWARLLLVPAHLQLDYAPQELVASSRFGLPEASGLLLLAGATASAWLLRRRAPVFTFGVLWAAVALAPVSNLFIPTGFLLAERTLFLPSIGFVLAVGGLLSLMPARIPVRDAALAGGALLVAGLARSAERQRVFRNEAFLSVRSVQDAPKSYRAQRVYGDVLFRIGQRDLALDAYRRALALAPAGNAWRVHNDLARQFRGMGETAPEVEALRASLSEAPGQEDTRGFLISALLLLGRYAEARAEIDTAMARGARPEVYRHVGELADSAARVGAPAGSIRLRLVIEPAR